jgi:hypothetical protein
MQFSSYKIHTFLEVQEDNQVVCGVPINFSEKCSYELQISVKQRYSEKHINTYTSLNKPLHKYNYVF